MTELIATIPRDKVDYGVQILKIKDAYSKNTYKDLEAIDTIGLLGIISIGGDALADSEELWV
ncbi:MAG: hypothetical protein ACE5J9_07765 [Methanosarcinales archaeon]